jgi:hypothetical protein
VNTPPHTLSTSLTHDSNSKFYRVIPNVTSQGGDISEKSDGRGGESIYGGSFEGESGDSTACILIYYRVPLYILLMQVTNISLVYRVIHVQMKISF